MTDPVFDTSGAGWRQPPEPVFSLTLVRPEDLLVLRVSFYDMRRDGDRMVPATAGQPGLMAIDLPTQHRAEEWTLAPTASTPRLWCFPRPFAGSLPDETIWQSRLVFQVTSEVLLTWEGLLDWSTHRPVLSERLQSFPRLARGADGAPPMLPPGPPGPLATSINLPAGLWTAPVDDGAWQHAHVPVVLPDATNTQASQIWYSARRGARGEAGVLFHVFGWQANRHGEPEPPLAISERARSDLARASLAHDAWLADRYVLSALGAWFRTDVTLGEDQLNTKSVSYEVDMGRDRAAVITGPGWLLPICCPSRWADTFDRDFVVLGNIPYAPWVKVDTLIQVLDRKGLAATPPWQGMTMEDATIHARNPGEGKPLCNFDGSPRMFPVNIIDARGVAHRTYMPLILVKETDLAAALTAWKPSPDGERHDFDLAGQSVHFADAGAAGFPPEAARLPTAGMTMRFLRRGTDGIDIRLEQATIAHPALDAFATPGVHKVAFPDPANPGRIDQASGRFLSLVEGGPALDFSQRADQVGGIASPSLKPAALSVSHGLLSKDAPSLPSAAEVFGSVKARLFGTLDLAKLFQGIGFDPPKLGPVDTKDARGVRFDWTHDIVPSTDGELGVLAARGGGTIPLTLRASILQPQPGSGPPEPQIDIFGSLTNFKLQFPAGGPLVEVEFDDATFHKAPNQQPQVTANIAQVNFTGELAFLEVLKRFLPPDGFSNPPDLKVDAAGAHLAYTLGLPAIGIGVFSLTNVRLAAGMEIPFTDGSGAAVSFFFSRFENPFQVSVLGFAGHGYFGFSADTSGLKMLDAAIEFGGAIDFSFGPVQGGICAAGGVRFTYTRVDDQHGNFAVAAYYHFYGGVTLFCIGVSIDATIALEYQYREESGSCFAGEVHVELTAHLCFFNKSFGFTVHKTFAGSSPQPRSGGAMGVSPGPAALLRPSARFEDAFDLPRWLAWNAAFAPAPAIIGGGH
jgi:hypothetical protein